MLNSILVYMIPTRSHFLQFLKLLDFIDPRTEIGAQNSHASSPITISYFLLSIKRVSNLKPATNLPRGVLKDVDACISALWVLNQVWK